MKFHGRTYVYPTPNDGRREIGVCQGLVGDVWIVAWCTDSGARRRVNTHHLPVSDSPDDLQALLDVWAAERRLRKS